MNAWSHSAHSRRKPSEQAVSIARKTRRRPTTNPCLTVRAAVRRYLQSRETLLQTARAWFKRNAQSCCDTRLEVGDRNARVETIRVDQAHGLPPGSPPTSSKKSGQRAYQLHYRLSPHNR